MGEDEILDASASSDPEGAALTFEWRDESSAVLGSNVTLTVTPPAGTHVYTLTVDDGALTATDEVIVHVLEEEQPTIEVAGIEGGAGSVTTDPPTAPCANTPGTQAFCPLDLPSGTLVTLTPQPSAGSAFVGWSGACSGTGACQVEVADDLHAIATFRGPRNLELMLSGEPGAWVTSA